MAITTGSAPKALQGGRKPKKVRGVRKIKIKAPKTANPKTTLDRLLGGK